MNPYIIAVSGGSGSGKTTLSKWLKANILEKWNSRISVSILSQDNYYRDQSKNFKGDGSINYDHPNAIDFDLMAHHLQQLSQGENIQLPVYDFVTHRRSEISKEFPITSVIIVDGILVLSQEILRHYYNFSIFLDIDEDVRFQRRLKRDVEERGRTPEGVRIQFFTNVKPMHDLFVEPSKKFASAIVSNSNEIEDVIEKVTSGISEYFKI